MFPRLAVLLRGRGPSCSAACSSLSSGCGSRVEHDRRHRRFTVTPGGGAGTRECAVLQYRFTGEKEVELMSTYVPEAFRSQGVAALLTQAAMNFLVEENLKAHVSCWYIKKYIEDHPLQHYKDLIIT
ncbi:hypothetical protein Q5P01_016900 [Channa striata]|uniref:Protein NATD1 n=1 Tax=Channa striata TaxID=64152 RepID=A0AA88MA74_CHASR|nr:hypothetical protein Q5P01_016900 [Channa striata]